MSSSIEDQVSSSRFVLVKGLAAVAALMFTGVAVAQTPSSPWPVPSVKYDFTQFDVDATPVTDPDGEITLTASLGDLVQDDRLWLEGSLGLGINSGLKNSYEIDGEEVLAVAATPFGSAQGVSGVWLSNLYCGDEGDNRGVKCPGDGGNGDAARGEQGTVEIDFIDPVNGLSCRAYHLTGTETFLGSDDIGGNAEVSFGVVLQMVAARFSTAVPSDVNDAGYGSCESLMPSPVGSNEFSVLGFVLEESEVIDTTTCTTAECPVINDVAGVTATIVDPPKGVFTVSNQVTVVDLRQACGGSGISNPPSFVINDDGSFSIDVDGQGAGPDVVIPAELCGIPAPVSGIPQITIIDMDLDLEPGSPFVDQIVDITVQNPVNTDYFCGNDDRYEQPVQAWIPRWWDTTEVPVPYNNGGVDNRSKVVLDVTSSCGSYGGRTRRLSYLVSNLRYHPETPYLAAVDFVAVVAGEIDRLEDTVEVSFACTSNGRVQSTLSSNVKAVKKWFNVSNYPKTVSQLERMRSDLDGSRLKTPLLGDCQVELETGTVFMSPTYDAGSGQAPALIWSYLQTQIDHLIYQIESKLQ
jgi:hypothetical protein